MLERPVAAAADRLGASDALLRTLSFLAVAALLLAAKALPDAPARRRFLVLTAASPLLLVYAAEARPYALLSALGVALFVLTIVAQERGSRLAATALLSAIALSTHYLAILLVASLAAVALARRRRRSAAALLLGAALFAPWLPTLARQPAEATAWMREPAPLSAVAMLSALGGGGRVPDPLGGPLPAALLWTGAGVGLFALAVAVAARPEAAHARDAALVTLATICGALLASLLGRPVAFPGRTELAVLPIWLWGLAGAGASSRTARLAASSAAALGAFSCLVLLLQAPRSNPPYVEEAERLTRLCRPGDLAAVGGASYLPARLQVERGRLAARLVALPGELEAHPGWIPARALDASERARLAEVLDGLAPGARAFVLLPAPLASAEVERLVFDGGPAQVLARNGGWILWVREARPRKS